MSKLELIRHLYEYNEWANARLLDTAEPLGVAGLSGEAATSWGIILATLGHIAGAQEVWLARWTRGQNPRPIVAAQALGTLADIRAALESTQAGLHEYIARLDEKILNADLEYRDSAGTENRRPLWQLMTHVANHGTYHRGEIAAALTALGHSPGDLDFIFWARDQTP